MSSKALFHSKSGRFFNLTKYNIYFSLHACRDPDSSLKVIEATTSGSVYDIYRPQTADRIPQTVDCKTVVNNINSFPSF